MTTGTGSVGRKEITKLKRGLLEKRENMYQSHTADLQKKGCAEDTRLRADRDRDRLTNS